MKHSFLFFLVGLVLTACAGGGGSARSVAEFNYIQPTEDSAVLNWTNPTLAAREGIYSFVIEYEALSGLGEAGVSASVDSQLAGRLDSRNRAELIREARSARTSRILDWDGDGVLVEDVRDPTGRLEGVEGDNCLHIKNANQLDMDGDRVGDVCDGVLSGLSFIPMPKAVRIRWQNPLEPMDAGGPREEDRGYAPSALKDRLSGSGNGLSFRYLSNDARLVVDWRNPFSFYSEVHSRSEVFNVTSFEIRGGKQTEVFPSSSAAVSNVSGERVSVELELANSSSDSEHSIEVWAVNWNGTGGTPYLIGSGCIRLADADDGDKLVACGTSRVRVIVGEEVFISNYTLRVRGPSDFTDQVVLAPGMDDAGGVSFVYNGSSVYLYNSNELVSEESYDFSLSFSYESVTLSNGNETRSVRTIDLSDGLLAQAHSAFGYVYSASVVLGENTDGDHLADSEDVDADNDGILDEDDPILLLAGNLPGTLAAGDPYRLRSALFDEVEIPYRGSGGDELAGYRGGAASSYNLTGLVNGSYYRFSVEAKIRTYANAELASILGYTRFGGRVLELEGAIDDDVADKVAMVALSTGGTYIGANNDGDELADVLDVDDDNDLLTDALEPDGVDGAGNPCRLVRDCDGDGLTDGEEYYKVDEEGDLILDGSGEAEVIESVVVNSSGMMRNCLLFIDCDEDGIVDREDAFSADPMEASDLDGDGVGDNGDNCPFMANSDQLDAEVAGSSVGDGRGDACEGDRTSRDFQYRGSSSRLDLTVIPRSDRLEISWKNVDLRSNQRDGITAIYLGWRLVDWNEASDDLAHLNASGLVDIFLDLGWEELMINGEGRYVLFRDEAANFDRTFRWFARADKAYQFNLAFGYGPYRTMVSAYDWTDYIWLGENTDGDEYSDLRDRDDDNDGLLDSEEGLTYGGVSCSLLRDCDEDNVTDGSDAFPIDPLESEDSDGDGIGDKADNFFGSGLDEDGDGIGDNADSCVLSPLNGLGGLSVAGSDGEGDGVSAVCDSNLTVKNDLWFTPQARSVLISWRNDRTNPTVGYRVGYKRLGVTDLIAKPEQAATTLYVEEDLAYGSLAGYSHHLLDALRDGETYYIQVNITMADGLNKTLGVNRFVDSNSNPILDSDLPDLYSVRIGANGDEDHLADVVDNDHDNDGLVNGDVRELLVNGDSVSCSLLADCDGDGVLDGADAFPINASESEDSDGDGVGDNADRLADNPLEVVDTDYDGIGDNVDNCDFFYNPSQRNRDGDMAGDSCDMDDDNLGVDSSGAPGDGRVSGSAYTYEDADAVVQVPDPSNENQTINQPLLSAEVRLRWVNPMEIYLPFAAAQPLRNVNLTSLRVEMRLADGRAVPVDRHRTVNITTTYDDGALSEGDYNLTSGEMNLYRVRGLVNGTAYRFRVVGRYDYERAAYLSGSQASIEVVLGVVEIETAGLEAGPPAVDVEAISGTDEIVLSWTNPAAADISAELIISSLSVTPCRYANADTNMCIPAASPLTYAGGSGVSLEPGGSVTVSLDEGDISRAYLYAFEVVVSYMNTQTSRTLGSLPLRTGRSQKTAIYPAAAPSVAALVVANGFDRFSFDLTSPSATAIEGFTRIGKGIRSYRLGFRAAGESVVHQRDLSPADLIHTDRDGVRGDGRYRIRSNDLLRLAGGRLGSGSSGLSEFEVGSIYHLSAAVLYDTGQESAVFDGGRVSTGPVIPMNAALTVEVARGSDSIEVSWSQQPLSTDFEDLGYSLGYFVGVGCDINLWWQPEYCVRRHRGIAKGTTQASFPFDASALPAGQVTGSKAGVLERGRLYPVWVTAQYLSSADLSGYDERNATNYEMLWGFYPAIGKAISISSATPNEERTGFDISWHRPIDIAEESFRTALGYQIAAVNSYIVKVCAAGTATCQPDHYVDDPDPTSNIAAEITTSVVGLTPGDYTISVRVNYEGRDSSASTALSPKASSADTPIPGLHTVPDIDTDGDGEFNLMDIDDDGDGLIEISTAAELDAVRYALDGSGQKLSPGGRLDTTGCGNGDTVTACNGYELTGDIDLADYIDETYADAGWKPLGNDTDPLGDRCEGEAFNGIFEGNGFMISNLSINRPNQDCVGLFGYIRGTVRNLNLIADNIKGQSQVGALVGFNSGGRIISSSVVTTEVSGSIRVGGLVGEIRNGRIISSSAAVNTVVKGTSNNIGGLVGGIHAGRIISSFAVVRLVRGSNDVGGLVGEAEGSRIVSSSAIAAEVRATSSQSSVGGLVGVGENSVFISSFAITNLVRAGSEAGVGGLLGYDESTSSRVVSSYAVASELRTSGITGGLVADAYDANVAYSYAVVGLLSGSDQGGLAAFIGSTRDSYWDSNTSGRTSGNGVAKTTMELQSPTGYEDIYASWDDGDNEATYCDEDASGDIGGDETNDDNRIWDFGSSTEYPAINCGLISPADQRGWYFLNTTTNKPQLNRVRLEEVLNP